MSFSQDVREELINHYSKQVRCRKAELAAIFMYGSKGLSLDTERGIYIYTDPRSADSRKTFNINGRLDASESIDRIISKPDAKRAFLRGAFIASGTISDPRKDYHFEIACPDKGTAQLIIKTLQYFDIPVKTVKGNSDRVVVYFKDSENISLILNIMEANKAMMEFENIHIERELRGAVNRRVNCDTANINKAIAAGARQVADIELIRDTIGLDDLEDGLRDICTVRLDNPDASLSELAELLTPKVGKSGVNHRLRKISKMAEDIRARAK